MKLLLIYLSSSIYLGWVLVPVDLHLPVGPITIYLSIYLGWVLVPVDLHLPVSTITIYLTICPGWVLVPVDLHPPVGPHVEPGSWLPLRRSP